MRRPAAPTRSLGSRSRTWIRSRRRSRRSRRPRGLRSRSNASSVGDSVPDARSPDPVASWERAPEARRVRGGLCSEVMSGPSLRGMGAALDPAATVLRVSAHHMPSAGKCSETFPECWRATCASGRGRPSPYGCVRQRRSGLAEQPREVWRCIAWRRACRFALHHATLLNYAPLALNLAKRSSTGCGQLLMKPVARTAATISEGFLPSSKALGNGDCPVIRLR